MSDESHDTPDTPLAITLPIEQVETSANSISIRDANEIELCQVYQDEHSELTPTDRRVSQFIAEAITEKMMTKHCQHCGMALYLHDGTWVDVTGGDGCTVADDGSGGQRVHAPIGNATAIDELEVTLEDEEAAHADTLRQLEWHKDLPLQLHLVQAGDLQVNSLFVWQGYLYVVTNLKPVGDEDVAIAVKRVAGGWTGNGGDRFIYSGKLTEDSERFMADCKVWQLMYNAASTKHAPR